MLGRLRFAAPLACLGLTAACNLEPLDARSPTPLVEGSGPDATAGAAVDLAEDARASPADLALAPQCGGIFVFDQGNTLYLFEPARWAFTALGTLDCGNTSGGPFSMAVARDGTAWVEYTTGDLYRLDTRTMACAPTRFVPDQVIDGLTWGTFGMGFASDGPGAATETLYVVGGSTSAPGPPPHVFGRITAGALDIVPISDVGQRAELTGTGTGDLWALFASATPHLARLDKASGRFAPDFSLAGLGDLTGYGFAFAAYGGDFYAFLNPSGGASTRVVRIDGATGQTTGGLSNTGLHIVGAGVSTCAPSG